ncbi:aminodeoxychorismate synthase component I [Glaciecola siphonariae]|uniref:aminodeoxychorismate synthase n=1 Tax=Glaciecola siphonariae TaxID=521012 RepID=A0ABV9LRT4_9ALTE
MSLLAIEIKALEQLKGVNARSVFARVQAQPFAMLLDTCNNRLSDGRYDIIVHRPAATYRYHNKKSHLSVNSEGFADLSSLVMTNSPFQDLSRIHQAFAAKVNFAAYQDHPLPFLIGCMGLFGYDINIQTDAIDDIKPQQYQLDDIAVGVYEQSLIFDNYTGEVFHVYVEGADEAWLDELLGSVHGPESHEPESHKPEIHKSENHKSEIAFKLLAPWQANMNEREYHDSMTAISEYLKAGDCYQINFAQRFSAPYEGSEWQAYEQLTAVNKAPFSSFIRLQNSTVICVSPERFISVKNRQVSTKPIKGTRKRSDDPMTDKALADALLNSEKDRAENLMIVDLLRNDLSKHCKPHSVKVPHLFALESYPAVHHMVSTVTGELKDDASPFDLLAGAFPGGSITGAPKVRAMQIIAELEPDKRSIYCGSIGYVGVRSDMDTNICIRTLLAENGVMHCWAGGGIVLDSEANDEYHESFHKVAKILPVLEASLTNPKNKKAS